MKTKIEYDVASDSYMIYMKDSPSASWGYAGCFSSLKGAEKRALELSEQRIYKTRYFENGKEVEN